MDMSFLTLYLPIEPMDVSAEPLGVSDEPSRLPGRRAGKDFRYP